MNNLCLNLKRIIFLSVVLFFSSSSFSQTTTINYLTSSLSSTACNVFSTNIAVNNVIHSSLAGGVSFNSTNGLYLDAQTQTTPFSGTGFVINYTFNSGYSYDISITANGDQFMYLNTSVVSDLNAFPITSIGSCTLDTKVSTWYTIGDGQLSAQCTGTSHTFNIPTFSISSGMPNYLVVWATGGNPSYAFDNLTISKIVITKTAIAPSFNLTPTTTALTCGTTSPVTFTVNNPGNVTGITNYTWNLGAIPNGWKLPDGSSAPATYSTSTNTLTLTPVCGSAQKNISATVTANGNSYNTNTSTVSVTPPTLSINGNSSVCGTPVNYSINGLPCNALVTWSITPATGIANLSCSSCATTSLSQVSNGIVTLTAVVSNLCGGSDVTLTKDIPVGSQNSLTGTYSTSSSTKPIQTVNFVPSGYINGQFQWPGVTNITLTASGSGTGFHSYGNSFNFSLSSGQSLSLYFTGTGTCGPVDATRAFVQSSYYYLVVSPNPATNNINVGITEVADTTGKMAEEQKLITSNTGGITKMYLYDFNTGILVKQWNFKEIKTSSYDLNIAGVKTGVYLLKMERNNKSTSTKIIIK